MHYSDKELKRRMAQIDSGRARYRELMDGNKWGDKSIYHLCMNTTGMGNKIITAGCSGIYSLLF